MQIFCIYQALFGLTNQKLRTNLHSNQLLHFPLKTSHYFNLLLRSSLCPVAFEALWWGMWDWRRIFQIKTNDVKYQRICVAERKGN
jgi:hypothetical protein